MEERFGHVEGDKERNRIMSEQVVKDEKLLREMTIDSDQVLPNARTRHWMLAQSHFILEEGGDDERKREAFVNNYVAGMQVDNFVEPDQADRQRAKQAYEAINDMMEKRDMNSNTLFEDFISERSLNLDRVSKIYLQRSRL